MIHLVMAEERRMRAEPRGRVWPNSAVVALSIVFLAGLGLRLVRLDAKPLWADEAYSVFFATRPFPDLIWFAAANDPHPPTYYLLLHGWMRLLGDSETAVRILSVLASAACIPLLYGFARTISGHAVSLLAAAILAVSPFHVAYAQEARSYALFTLLTLASTLAFLRLIDRPSRGRWVAYVSLMIFTLWVHYFALFLLSAHALIALLADRVWKRSASPRLFRWTAVAAAGGGFLPALPMLAQQSTRGDITWIPPSTPGMLAWVLQQFLSGNWLLPSVPYVVTYLVSVGAALLLVSFGILALNRSGPLWLLPVIWFIVPVAGSWVVGLVVPIFIARYLLFATPPLYVMLAAGLIWLTRRFRAAGVAVSIGAILITGASLLASYADPGYPWRDVVHLLDNRCRTGDVVLFVPSWSQMPFEYSARYSHLRCQTASSLPDSRGFASQQELISAPQGSIPIVGIWLVDSLPSSTEWTNRIMASDDRQLLQLVEEDWTSLEQIDWGSIRVRYLSRR